MSCVPLVSLSSIGWLYELQRLAIAGVGPRVGDALPLLQLASRDGQPLARVVLACLPCGVLAGITLSRLPRWRRAAWCGLTSAFVLVVASQASDAVARNTSLLHTVLTRSPGAGPWVEAAVLALSSIVAPQPPSSSMYSALSRVAAS